jgi:peroxiredoxin
MKTSCFRLMLTVVGLVLGSVLAPAADPIVGQPAPDFTLKDSHGQARSLKDFSGKYVVLEWTNYECPFVLKHYGSGNMQKLQKEYTAKGVVWLSICSSGPGKQGNYAPDEINKRMADLQAAPTAYLLDGEGTVGKTYGAKSTPTIFVINPKGLLVYSGAADSIPSADQADIPKATNYIEATLDEAMSGKPVLVASTKSYGCAVHY